MTNQATGQVITDTYTYHIVLVLLHFCIQLVTKNRNYTEPCTFAYFSTGNDHLATIQLAHSHELLIVALGKLEVYNIRAKTDSILHKKLLSN